MLLVPFLCLDYNHVAYLYVLNNYSLEYIGPEHFVCLLWLSHNWYHSWIEYIVLIHCIYVIFYLNIIWVYILASVYLCVCISVIIFTQLFLYLVHWLLTLYFSITVYLRTLYVSLCMLAIVCPSVCLSLVSPNWNYSWFDCIAHNCLMFCNISSGPLYICCIY